MPSRRMRTTSRSDRMIGAWLAAGALFAPVALHAQAMRGATDSVRVASASAPQTRPATGGGAARSHVVAEGETLWSLAARYLGDGHRWEEIAALNRSVVGSARALSAGTRLILPGDAADALPTKVSNGVAELPREGGASLDEFYARFAGRTVFFGVQRSTAVLVPPPTLGLQSAGVGSEPSVVRTAPAADGAKKAVGVAVAGAGGANGANGALLRERLTAPWLDDDTVAVRAGAVRRRLDVPAVAGNAGGRELHLYDRVSLSAPRDEPAREGREYLAISLGDSIAGVGRVVLPLGVVRVVRADSAARGSEGVIVAKFGTIEEGVRLVVPPAEVADRGVGSAEHDAGASGAVVAVIDGAVLPTLQHMVLVDVGAERGVRAGDRVTFYRDLEARDREATSGEVAQGIVMRVSLRGASALIVRQSQPALGEGTPVRVARPLP
jgi:hypothetical protein